MWKAARRTLKRVATCLLRLLGFGKKSPPIAEAALLEGAWWALQQSGRLLASATLVCDGGDVPTGFALAMLGCEELGRHKLLLAMAGEVRGGKVLRADEVHSRARDHLDKHARGALSVVFRSGKNDKLLGPVFSALDTATIGSEEWKEARAKLDAAVATREANQPQSRHRRRMSAMYVDLGRDGKSWRHPTQGDAKVARWEIHDAVNDYSTTCSNLIAEIFADPKLCEVLGVQGLAQCKPKGLVLPQPSWPRLVE